jgi:hypothetical protein
VKKNDKYIFYQYVSPNQKNKMEVLKYTINFVKKCNLKMLYLVFGNEVSFKHLKYLFSNALFTHFMMQLFFILMKFTFSGC